MHHPLSRGQLQLTNVLLRLSKAPGLAVVRVCPCFVVGVGVVRSKSSEAGVLEQDRCCCLLKRSCVCVISSPEALAGGQDSAAHSRLSQSRGHGTC